MSLSERYARLDKAIADKLHEATDLLNRIPLLEKVLEAAREYEAAYEGNGKRPDIAKRDLFAAIRAATEKT